MAFLLLLIAGIFLFSFIGVIWLLKRTGKLERELEELRRTITNLTVASSVSIPPKLPEIQAAETPEAREAPPVKMPEKVPAVTSELPAKKAIETFASLKRASRPEPGPIAAFIKSGNYWAGAGVLLLIVGFALFISYMARRGFFSLEMRIAVAALSGLAMVCSGWIFRKRKPLYFLILQGGGIAVLYLTVFAAHKLTDYVPVWAALALMSILVPAAVAIALFQGSQTLAFIGFLGGFAAPVLLASEEGHIAFLFAYYTILSLGIVIIAFFRSWKSSSLLGFVSSFAMSLYWLLTTYQKEDVAITGAFLTAFVVIYTVLGIILLNKNRQKAGVNYIEWTIILGTPFLGIVTLWKTFSIINHGYALVSFGFAAFYLILAFSLLKKKLPAIPKILIEIYGALALLLVNIIIPLELSGFQSSLIWAVEAVVVFYLGLRRNDIRIQITALIIHAAAAICYIIEKSAAAYGPLRSTAFWGTLIIAASAFLMLILSKKAALKNAPAFLSKNSFLFTLLLWAFAWYYTGWWFELWRICQNRNDFFAWYFMVVSGSALFFYISSKVFNLPHFNLAVLPSIAAGLCAMIGPFFENLVKISLSNFTAIFTHNYFHNLWLWAWLAFILVQLSLLISSGKTIPFKFHAPWFFSFILIVLPVLTFSLRYLTVHLGLESSWTALAGIMPLLLCLFLLSALFKRIAGTNNSHRFFLGILLPWILCVTAALWFTVTLFMSGDPAPLPLYLPVLNPLELLEALCAALIILCQLKANKIGLPAMKNKAIITAADIMGFFWITAILVRIIHFYGNIPYHNAVFTDAFRFSLFIFWAVWGIGHIIAGHRLGIRSVWIAGAILTVSDMIKLLLFDLANVEIPIRIASFFIAGIVLLFIGWVAPLPPAAKRNSVP